MIKKLTIIVITLLPLRALSQQIPVIIQGATIHLGNGQVINNGIIGFDSGRIVFVDSIMRNSYKNARFINATGKHVYPGIILLNTYLGLNEIDAVRSTRDFQETGELNPNVRTLIAYNTDSKVIPTATHNGILYMQVVPQGGIISGTSCVVKTDAFNWEDAAIKEEDGIHLNWPEVNHYLADKSGQEKVLFDHQNTLKNFFNEALQYNQQSIHHDVNLRYQAMQGLFLGNKTLYVHANSARGILEALQFTKQYPIAKIVLVTGSDASLVIPEIKAAKIPVIVNLIHSLPNHNHSDVDQPYKTAAQLMRAGIITAIGHSGSWESRNVMFNAGTCAAYGLTPEEALQLITGNAALVTNAQNEIGTLEVGKSASILISDGDLLDMKSSRISEIFLNGISVPVDNSQTELYKKYSTRYGVEVK